MVDFLERNAVLRIVMDAMFLINGNDRVQKRVAFLEQGRMVEMVTHFPCFLESILACVCKPRKELLQGACRKIA